MCIFLPIRNKALEANGAKPPKATSTGTTIVGVVFKVNNRVFLDKDKIKQPQQKTRPANTIFTRMALFQVLIPELLKDLLLPTRIVKRSIILLPTCKICKCKCKYFNLLTRALVIVVVLVQLQIPNLPPTSSVLKLNYTAYQLEESLVSLQP